jgi:hypothetical protein
MDNTIRLKLQLLQFADAATARTLLAELEAQCRQNADAFEDDKIGAAQFGASAKELQSAIKSVQSALAQFDDAEDELFEQLGQQVAAQIAAAESAERLAQAEAAAATAAKSEADYAELLASEERAAAAAEAEHAHALEMLAAATQHETVMLRHLEDQTREETEAAARWAQQQREAATAAEHLSAADRDLNASLRDDAAAEARARLAALDAEARELTTALARGDTVTEEMVASLNRLDAEAGQVRNELKGLEAAARAEAGAMDQSAAASRRAGTAAHQVGTDLRTARQGALDLARGVQDFAQGGFGGIINNLEGLGRGIPALLKAPMQLLTNLPTVLTLVGVALYEFGPKVYNAFRHFAFGSNAIPEAADALGKIDGRLKEVTKQLDAYREAQTLTNKELADYNRLSAEQLVLENAKEKAAEDKAARKKMLEANPAQEDEEKDRAKLFEETMGDPGQRKALVESVRNALPQLQRQKLSGELMAAIKERDDRAPNATRETLIDLNRKIEEARSKLDAENTSLREQAEALVTGAVSQGRRQQTESIRGFMREQPGKFTDFQQFAFGDPNAEDTLPDGTRVHSKERSMEPLDAARAQRRSMERQKEDVKNKRVEADRQEKQRKADEAVDKWLRDLEESVADESAKQIKAATQDVLKRDKSSGATDESAKEIAGFAAKRLKLKDDELFEYVQAEMVKVLTGAAAGQGVKTIDQKLIRDASRQAAGKALGRQEKADESEEKRDDKADDDAENQARKDQRETIKKSGKDIEAGALYAKHRAAGKSHDEAFDLTNEQVYAYLDRVLTDQFGRVMKDKKGQPIRANANMTPAQKGVLAAQITSQGKDAVGAQVKALSGQNLTNTGKLLAVAGQLDAEVAQLGEKSRQQQQQIDGLMRQVNARQRSGARR